MRKIFTCAAVFLLCGAAVPVCGEVETSEKVWTAEVLGMSCPLCSNNIEKQLKKDQNVKSVYVDLGTGTVTVSYLNPPADPEKTIKKAIELAGFTVKTVRARDGGP